MTFVLYAVFLEIPYSRPLLRSISDGWGDAIAEGFTNDWSNVGDVEIRRRMEERALGTPEAMWLTCLKVELRQARNRGLVQDSFFEFGMGYAWHFKVVKYDWES